MIINLDGTAFELPSETRAHDAIGLLETDERTAFISSDDPFVLIGLAQAVHNELYNPSPFSRQQLIGHYESLIEAIEEACDIEPDDQDADEDDKEGSE